MEPLADVIIDRVAEALDRAFTYRIPDVLQNSIAIGQLVSVPFRGTVVAGVVRRVYSGLAISGLKDIVGIRDAEPVVTPPLLELAEWMCERYLCYLPQALRAMIPASVRKSKRTRPSQTWYRVQGTRQGRPSRKQSLFEYIARCGAVDRRTLLDAFPQAGPALHALIQENVVEVMPLPPQDIAALTTPHPLTPEQDRALRSFLQEPATSWLLEGVTGSGKTEVYLALIADALERGKQALVLLPEIALTPQTVTRFRGRFGSGVAVWHSGLSQDERRQTWEAVRQGRLKVVVGARSAIFLPFTALAVIVIDEEHEPSYKQEEHPRYHTREVALWRGKREGALVVLGSATPSLESRYKAQSGEMGHVQIPRRVLGRTMPTVEIVDMRDELKEGNRHIFSRLLQDEMSRARARDEQIILFLNRRGYSTFVLCRSCGQALECPDCAVSLTYHQQEERLACHYCLRQFPLPKRCPECGSEKIRYFGAGTERVVEEVRALFPQARLLRADRDVLKDPQDYATLYHQFYRGEADVLVGTQMIAKGMDFPRVGLVGVVAADTALHLPDFRSAERTFQLLVQAGGRSGRADIPGRVVIQSYNPDHYAIKLAKTHDYSAFYEEEIAFRSATRYPPFSQLWLLAFEGEDRAAVAESARQGAEALRAGWPGDEVLGPAPAPLSRVRGRYRYHVLLKHFADPGKQSVVPHLKELQNRLAGLRITRDPYLLM